MTDPATRARIRELHEKATAGPYCGGGQYIVTAGEPQRNIANFPSGGGSYHGVKNHHQAKIDRDFVEAVLNAIPDILRDWERLEKYEKALREIAEIDGASSTEPGGSCGQVARAAMEPDHA